MSPFVAGEEIENIVQNFYHPGSGPNAGSVRVLSARKGQPSGADAGRIVAGAIIGAAKSGSNQSPEITPEEVTGKSRSEIRQLAKEKGLKPFGDSASPDYPRKWKDPANDEQRLRLDRGHIDSETGEPFNVPNAAIDHVHAYKPNGNKIKVNNDHHIPTTGE